MSQKQIVLSMLERAGERGVTSNEFFAEHLPRFSARLYELRNEGHNITTSPSDNGFVYTLVGGQDGSKGTCAPRVAVLTSGQSPDPVSERDMDAAGTITLRQVCPAASESSTACGLDAAKKAASSSSTPPSSGGDGLLSLFDVPSRLYEDAA